MKAADIDDARFMEFVINYIVPFPVMLGYAGLDKDSYDYIGKVYCPFHRNEDTPAAKMYKNPRGDTIYCFSEQRVYRPVDVVKNKMIKKSIESVFRGLWKQIDDFKRERIIELYDSPISYVPEAWENNRDNIGMFRAGKIDYTDYIKFIIQSID